jgi:hypothetical protein
MTRFEGQQRSDRESRPSEDLRTGPLTSIRWLLPAVIVLACTMTIVSPVAAYNPTAAKTYADTWWHSRNSSYKNFDPNDCTNFVSQALHAGGGYPFQGTGGSTTNYNNWFIQNILGIWNWSHTWSVAPDLLNFLYYDYPGGYARGYFAPYQGSSSGGVVGDVVFYDWGDDQGVSHDSIQVAYGTDPNSGWVGDLVDAHDSDRYHAIWHLRPYNANLAALTYITVVHVDAGN